MNIFAADPEIQEKHHVEPGQTVQWTRGQLSVASQKPIEEVDRLVGAFIKYLGGLFKVLSVQGDNVTLERVPVGVPLAADFTGDINVAEDVSPQNPTMTVLDVFENPVSDTDIEVALRVQKTGPVGFEVLYPGKGQPTRDTVEKRDVVGPELKSPRPPLIRSPQYNEPEDTGRRISHAMPDESFVRQDIEALFKVHVSPVLASKFQPVEFIRRITDNYIKFQSAVLERYQTHYPELIDELLEGYRTVTASMMQSSLNR